MAAYAALNDCDYADKIIRAADAKITSIRAVHLQTHLVLDPEDVAANFYADRSSAERRAAMTDDEAARAAAGDSE